MFYFSFSDQRKQRYRDALLSLVAQVGKRDPAFSALAQAYAQKSRDSKLTEEECEDILTSAMNSFDEFFMLLDALDECSSDEGGRIDVLEGVERLLHEVPKLKIFATSREVVGVGNFMAAQKAFTSTVDASSVDADVELYLDSRFRHWKNPFQPEMCQLIKRRLLPKTDGMFRYAVLQWEALCKVKAKRPDRIDEVLRNLPKGLDESYKRILQDIKPNDREDAVILLQWLAYAEHPPRLGELMEAVIINPEEPPYFDRGNLGSLDDALEILVGLVTLVEPDPDSNNDVYPPPTSRMGFDEQKSRDETNAKSISEGMDKITISDDTDKTRMHRTNSERMKYKVRLAHFSVKEYLESDRLQRSSVEIFHLDEPSCHRMLTKSCLAYLRYYSNSSDKTRREQDFESFLLLSYAANSWHYHSSRSDSSDFDSEIAFLEHTRCMQDWLVVSSLETWDPSYDGPLISAETGIPASALYYASLLGIERLVNVLLQNEHDPNARGGYHGTALEAASSKGHRATVEFLLQAGARVDEPGRHEMHDMWTWVGMENVHDFETVDVVRNWFSRPLLTAASNQDLAIVELLLAAGANVNAQSRMDYSNALITASNSRGHANAVAVARRLLKAGARVNEQGYAGFNAVQAALRWGNRELVELLVEEGADLTARTAFYMNALAAACGAYDSTTALEMAELVLSYKVVDINAIPDDPNLRGGSDAQLTPLEKASAEGHVDVVKLLLDLGANIEPARIDSIGPLCVASRRGHCHIIELLLAHGARIDPQHSDKQTALHYAAVRGKHEAVKLLLDRGADIHAHAARYGTPLTAASSSGDLETVKLLLERGADINDPRNGNNSALICAAERGHADAVEFLVSHGAELANSRDKESILERVMYSEEYSEMEERKEVIQVLLKLGVRLSPEVFSEGSWRDEQWIDLIIDEVTEYGPRPYTKILLEHGAFSEIAGTIWEMRSKPFKNEIDDPLSCEDMLKAKRRSSWSSRDAVKLVLPKEHLLV